MTRYAILTICAGVVCVLLVQGALRFGYRAGYADGQKGADTLMVAGMHNGFGAGWYACFLAADSLTDSTLTIEEVAQQYGYSRAQLPNPAVFRGQP